MRSGSFRNVLAFFLALALIISIAPESFAASKKKSDEAKELYNKAVKYEYSWDSRDYEKAFDCYCKAADLGNADAMAELGWIYAVADGSFLEPHGFLSGELEIQQDIDHAYELFKKAADLNCPSGIAGLGYLKYEDSDDINEKCEFFKLLKKAASMGDPKALMYLGDLYCYLGNNSKGVDCYTKAAAENYPDVLYYIAFVYYDGGGYDTGDYNELYRFTLLSFSYFLKSGELGHPDGANMASNVIAQFDHPDDIKKLSKDKNVDFKKAFKTASALASYNDYGAMQLLGYLYEHGLGVKQNTKTAQKWYDKAEAAYEAQYNDYCS